MWRRADENNSSLSNDDTWFTSDGRESLAMRALKRKQESKVEASQSNDYCETKCLMRIALYQSTGER